MSSGGTAFTKALEWLYGTQLFGVKLGLDSMHRLVDELQIDLKRPNFFHVAGTNGKGSTCAMIDSVCRDAGLRSGLYTSPHLLSFRERIQVNGQGIPESAAAEGLERIREMVTDWNPHPTFFEITTALALKYFQDAGTEVVVLETGLGGRLDATNVVQPTVCVLTAIGMDHQQALGDTLTLIAEEKAGILKPGVPVVSGWQQPEVVTVIERVAQKRGCELKWVTESWNRGAMGLAGAIQRQNAALAVTALQAAGWDWTNEIIASGLAQVKWPGRFQMLGPRLVLDGAHNAPAAAALVATWRERFPGETATLIFGALADKDVASVLRELAPIVGQLIVVPVRNPRALAVETLLDLARQVMPQVAGSVALSLAEALQKSTRDRTLVAGSLYLVGEALGIAEGIQPEWSAQ